MIKTLEAMECDMFIVRHSSSGTPHYIAKEVGKKISIINAGDGIHAHPTQAMLDMYTIKKHKGSFENLNVSIVGDILHSRVAKSLITMPQNTISKKYQYNWTKKFDARQYKRIRELIIFLT